MGDQFKPETMVKQIYASLEEMGLRQNREKWYLDDAGHRGYAVDVGTSYGEVAIRITENGIQTEAIRITRSSQFEDAMAIVELDVARVKAKSKEVAK